MIERKWVEEIDKKVISYSRNGNENEIKFQWNRLNPFVLGRKIQIESIRSKGNHVINEFYNLISGKTRF